MFEIQSEKLQFQKDNLILQKNISLDTDLDCFIILSSKNHNLCELIMKNSLDYIIDKISITETYEDFSIALENINAFLKTWKIDTDKEVKIDMVIWILNGNNLVFSNIWEASALLVNKDHEIIPLTEDNSNTFEFGFISNWKLSDGEVVIFTNTSSEKYLSESDILDGLTQDHNIDIFHQNITDILKTEITSENIAISNILYKKFDTFEASEENPYLTQAKEIGIKLLDNNFAKRTLASFQNIHEKIMNQSKLLKNVIFLCWISVCLVFLFSLVSTFVNITTEDKSKELSKSNLQAAKTYLSLASENLNNMDIFELHVTEAEKLIAEIESQQMFLNDISKIQDEIGILKKQFNKIESFRASTDNSIFESDLSNSIQIIKNNKKLYSIEKKGIIWPIITNNTPKTSLFSGLNDDEFFTKAVNIGTSIYLTTNQSRVVQFSKSGRFSFIDVSGQKTWQKHKDIASYGSNLYLLGQDNNQIYRHALSTKSFNKWDWYLKEEDLKQLWEILSISIDGGFYILKSDLSIVKFFRSPKYRLEGIVLNKLPKNYKNDGTSPIKIKAGVSLNYVYILMNNKVWVFQPNTTNKKNTTSLTYIGQIEAEQDKIKDFYVNRDGEALILSKKWIYKLNFEISNDKIIVR